MGQETPPAESRRSDSRLARPGPAAFIAVLTSFALAAAAHAVYRAHTDRMWSTTGAAEWIWYPVDVSKPAPIRFTASQAFALPSAPASARAKVFVDHAHVLIVNGVRAGRGTQRAGDPLAVTEIAPLLRAGENRIEIEAWSPTGVGGVLFSLDVDGFGRDALVSGPSWRVRKEGDAVGHRPRVWGRPPQDPWGYPRMPRPNEVSGFGAARADEVRR